MTTNKRNRQAKSAQAGLRAQTDSLKEFILGCEELTKNGGVQIEGLVLIHPDVPGVLQQLKTELASSHTVLEESEVAQRGMSYDRHVHHQQKVLRRLTFRAKSMVTSIQRMIENASPDQARTEKTVLVYDDRLTRLETSRTLGRGAKDPLGLFLVLATSLLAYYSRKKRIQ